MGEDAKVKPEMEVKPAPKAESLPAPKPEASKPVRLAPVPPKDEMKKQPVKKSQPKKKAVSKKAPARPKAKKEKVKARPKTRTKPPAKKKASKQKKHKKTNKSARHLINFKVSEAERAKIQRNADKIASGGISQFLRLIATATWDKKQLLKLL